MINNPNPIITAIIPVRLSKDRLYDEIERIDRILKTLPPAFGALLVDYGTVVERRQELIDVCRENGCDIVRVETADEPFSVGHARDVGAQNSSTPLVMFHDIDFLMSKESYNRIVEEARLIGMPDNAYAFFALPGTYLQRDFTTRYLSLHAEGRGSFADMLVHDGVMRADKNVYEHHTFAISAIVVNRLHLLAVGGHDKSFTGHGAEDFELMHRLTSYYMKGPRTKDYYSNTRKNDIRSYEGFRAFYALYGLDLFQRGLVISHLWHPRRSGDGYTGTNNQARVSQSMKDYDRGITSLQPLEDLTSTEFTLVLVKPNTSPARALRHAFPILGRFRCIPENSFSDASSLIEFIREEKFTRVLFLNPYGNEHRLSLYRAVKENQLRFIAYDRGALNNSWFFDDEGFLGESGSYRRQKWDHPISGQDAERTTEFVRQLKLANETLEKNGSSVGPEHLRQALRIGDRKVLFVAFQRPSDTATVHFGGACGGAAGFNEWISYLSSTIDRRRYVIVAKKHPLEAERPPIENVIFAPDDTHINDLIDMCEKVIVINSGVGLIAAAYKKPTICCGESFYAHDGFAFSASSPEQLLKLSSSELPLSDETRLRFLKYLIFDFYSFGKTEYKESIQSDGSLRAIASKIVYSEIRRLTPLPVRLGEVPPGVSLDAPLFYSYGGRSAIERSNTGGAKTEKKEDLMRRATSVGANDNRHVSAGKRHLKAFVGRIVAISASRKGMAKYERDPAHYFADLKNPFFRYVGSALFASRR